MNCAITRKYPPRHSAANAGSPCARSVSDRPWGRFTARSICRSRGPAPPPGLMRLKRGATRDLPIRRRQRRLHTRRRRRLHTAPAAHDPAAHPALAFLLGFIPGVGAIYNGQYAKG